MSAARFAKLIEKLQSLPIRNSVVLETLQLTLTSKWGRRGGKTCLVHFTNIPLDFWLRISQKLKERGYPWEDFPLLDVPGLPPTVLQKHTVHNREFGPPFWFTAPASCNCIPNGVLQPLVPTWVGWTGWSLPEFDIGDHIGLITAIVWQNLREDLAVTGRLYQVVGWFTAEERTLKQVIAME